MSYAPARPEKQPTAVAALRAYFLAWVKTDPSLKPYLQLEDKEELCLIQQPQTPSCE